MAIEFEGRRTLPAFVRLVNSVDDVEGVRVFGFQRVELFLEEDILGRDVCEEQSELGLVAGVRQSVLKDLVHGRAIIGVSDLIVGSDEIPNAHAATTSNHTNLLKLVGYRIGSAAHWSPV